MPKQPPSRLQGPAEFGDQHRVVAAHTPFEMRQSAMVMKTFHLRPFCHSRHDDGSHTGVSYACAAISLASAGDRKGGIRLLCAGIQLRGADGWISRDPDAEEGTKVPQDTWSDKRERQYEHVKEGLRERGRPEGTAEEIAARTVNKERARAGESEQASRTSTRDMSSGRRGGLRSHRGAGGRTKAQLYAEARRRGIAGRSRMTKDELERAVGR
jgi:hypothetical protein